MCFQRQTAYCADPNDLFEDENGNGLCRMMQGTCSFSLFVADVLDANPGFQQMANRLTASRHLSRRATELCGTRTPNKSGQMWFAIRNKTSIIRVLIFVNKIFCK